MCSFGHKAQRLGKRAKQNPDRSGARSYERGYYVCPTLPPGSQPLDRELDAGGLAGSPGVLRIIPVVGSESSFDWGREQKQLLAGIERTAKAVERQAEAHRS
jgi:hypothetical protein